MNKLPARFAVRRIIAGILVLLILLLALSIPCMLSANLWR
jgi:hypothetical protein